MGLFLSQHLCFAASKTFCITLLALGGVALLATTAQAEPRPPSELQRATDEPATILGEWQTGNTRLRPFTCTADSIYLSGDTTAEMWDTHGKQLWQTKLATPSHFRPRLSNGVMVVAGRKSLAALDARTGKTLWNYTAGDDAQLSVPLIAAGKVVVGLDSWLKAFDAQTGEELWEFEIVLPRLIAYPPIAYQDKWILLGPGDGNLYAIDINDGSLVWKNNTGKNTWQYLRQLYIAQDSRGQDILVAGGYKDDLYGIKIDNGEVKWRFYGGNFINSHMVSDNETYFWSPTGWIYSLNVRNGYMRWRHLTDDHRASSGLKEWGHFMAELIADDKVVYALDMRDTLHILDRTNGDELKSYDLPFNARFFVCTTGDNKTVFVGSQEGQIVKVGVDF
ncbi:MAG: PQQ-binding-like beta-propeller repeat protein [Magnetovibrio sp.]|nr:PQQ-binding-like beta-propeller repeat protein [Magnetovibrio sp.]